MSKTSIFPVSPSYSFKQKVC